MEYMESQMQNQLEASLIDQAYSEGSAKAAMLADLLTKAMGDISAALIMAGKQDKIAKWTAPYVKALNAFDAEAEQPPTPTGDMVASVEAMRAACIEAVRAEQKYEASDFPVCNAIVSAIKAIPIWYSGASTMGERDAIVTWLRDRQEIFRSEYAVSVDPAVRAIADAIERGDHLTAQAKAMEARRAETGTGSVHDSAVPQAFAQPCAPGDPA